VVVVLVTARVVIGLEPAAEVVVRSVVVGLEPPLEEFGE